MPVEYNILLKEDRKKIIEQIKSEENQTRKRESFKQVEVFNGRLTQYVEEYLNEQFSADTAREMTKISTINIQKRIVKSEATVYKKPPQRKFTDVTPDQEEAVKLIYKDMKANSKFRKSNESFKLQNQNFMMVIPKKGKLITRVLRAHQIDAIPDWEDPETAAAYIISGFDRSQVKDSSAPQTPTGYVGRSNPNKSGSNMTNEIIADEDDYMSTVDRYVYWSEEYHFKMDGDANIVLADGTLIENVSEELLPEINSPLQEYSIIPIVEVAVEKDFEFFVRQEAEATEFTIQFNGTLSDLAQIVKLQGYAQAILTGPEEMMAEELRVGPNIVLKLVVDPEKGIEPKFQYANPNPDINGSLEFAKIFLSLFLSSKGIDPKIISATGESINYSSGIERLLAMFEKFEATQEDFDIYKDAESDFYAVVRAWHNALLDSDKLLPKYKSSMISMESEIQTIYDSFESVQTESERVTNFVDKRDAELTSRVEFFMKGEHLSHKEAVARAVKVQVDEALVEKYSRLVGHLHDGLGPAIDLGSKKHTHMDLSSGELVESASDLPGHVHTISEGVKSDVPILIDSTYMEEEEVKDGIQETGIQSREI